MGCGGSTLKDDVVAPPKSAPPPTPKESMKEQAVGAPNKSKPPPTPVRSGNSTASSNGSARNGTGTPRTASGGSHRPSPTASQDDHSSTGSHHSNSHASMGTPGGDLSGTDDASVSSGKSGRSGRSLRSGRNSLSGSGNPKALLHSNSILGLDKMIDDRKQEGDLKSNMVHIEVPFGKPIEEVYDGVHDGPVLGSGISGLVRLITHRSTGVKYAVKCLDLGLVETEEGLQQLREEIYIMCQLDHPNIVRLEEVYESFSEIYLVQELCLGGELFDRLDEQPDYHYTEAECARLVKQMLCAVRYIHSKGIIHRDLKLENFLFSSKEAGSELRMIDFGLSKHFKFGEVQHEAVGTPYTVAPEVIRGCYDERCDVWAIGVITFLLLSGDPPFGGCGGPEPLMQVRENILRGHFDYEPEDVWESVSPQAKDFIKKLLVTDPNRRPTARETQRSKWLSEWTNKDRNADDNVLNPNVVKALVNFKEYSDMRKLLCEVLSFTLLPDQIADLRQEFEKLDTDGSGEISLTGLKQVLISNAGSGTLGALTEEEVEDIFNAMRVRKTETRIHWHEFIAAGLSQCKVDDRNLRLAFDRLDADHKGFITFENVTDLLGHDPSHSEDAMKRMWGDSMKAVNSEQARITYEDFLLLMKGQTKQDDAGSSSASLGASFSSLMTGDMGAAMHASQGHMGVQGHRSSGGLGMSISVLPDIHEAHEELASPSPEKDPNVIVLPSGDVVTKSNGSISEVGAASAAAAAAAAIRRKSSSDKLAGSDHTNHASDKQLTSWQRRMSGDHAPTLSPSDHGPAGAEFGHIDNLSDDDFEGGLTMDADDLDDERISAMADKTMAGLMQSTNTANLTPPQSPRRGAVDYITPVSQREKLSPVSLGNAPVIPDELLSSVDRPSLVRRRSRSVDDQDSSHRMIAPKAAGAGGGAAGVGAAAIEPGEQSPGFPGPDVRRAMLLPEHDHNEPDVERALRDEKKTPLEVNRTLYRAHRQMRLAVMEASKRFEEQQITRTRQMLEQRGGQPCGAGLTMRRGHAPEMSIEQIREVIKDQQKQQRTQVDKAQKKGGRGRGRRKKTVSDMAGMLSSVPPTEIVMNPSPVSSDTAANHPKPTTLQAAKTSGAAAPQSDSAASQPVAPLRHPTTPGDFRKTVDPFAEFSGYRAMVGLQGASGARSIRPHGGESFMAAAEAAERQKKPSLAPRASAAPPPPVRGGSTKVQEILSLDASVHSMRSIASDGDLKQMEAPSPQTPIDEEVAAGEGGGNGGTWPPPPPL